MDGLDECVWLMRKPCGFGNFCGKVKLELHFQGLLGVPSHIWVLIPVPPLIQAAPLWHVGDGSWATALHIAREKLWGLAH